MRWTSRTHPRTQVVGMMSLRWVVEAAHLGVTARIALFAAVVHVDGVKR